MVKNLGKVPNQTKYILLSIYMVNILLENSVYIKSMPKHFPVIQK